MADPSLAKTLFFILRAASSSGRATVLWVLMIPARCRTLRQHGYSIGQIARLLQLSKSTVHWHTKDIVLTRGQRDSLREQKRRVMMRVNARRRGIPLRPVSFRKPAWSAKLVHLVAHLSFDGRIDRYGCHYYNRSRPQARHVQQLLKTLLGFRARMRRRSDEIWEVSYYNVAVAAWLSHREHELFQVLPGQMRWQRQWLQAFFDDEGHIHLSKSVRRIRASQADPQILEWAKRFLENMEIRGRIDRRAQAIEITGRGNLIQFRNRVNFSSGLRVNPNRLNGLWNWQFEKRTLLDKALGSYKSSFALSQLSR